jgi:hypothetical protein
MRKASLSESKSADDGHDAIMRGGPTACNVFRVFRDAISR